MCHPKKEDLTVRCTRSEKSLEALKIQRFDLTRPSKWVE